MLLEVSLNKRKELYEDFLREIGSIKFTFREIDVISCIMHNRGEKKIASLLQISPRTVGTHLHNIMLKLGQNSRESIIDFIEKSGKLPYIKKCYFHILIQSAFEQSLVKIGKTINRKVFDCFVNISQLSEKEKNKLNNIIDHLKLANINLIKNINFTSEVKFNIHCITNKFNSKITSVDILLLIEKSDIQENFLENNYIDFCLDKNYYFSFFALLEKILGIEEVREIKEDFFSEYKAISESWEGRNISKDNNKIYKQDVYSKVEQTAKRLYIIPSILLLGMVFYYLFDISKILTTSDISSLRSELFLPQEGVLLSRGEIISKIKSAFKDSKDINTIALVGIGGSGKSTIAKKYAKESGAKIIWRINAESRGSIVSSMKQIAYTIASKEKEREEVDKILAIKDASERERGLLLFLREKAKSYPGWLIIYDNVKSFNDIKRFYPHDSIIWGNGNVIITTSNNNIVHNDIILSENVITVGGLTDQEKAKLFISILEGSKKKYDIDYDQCLNDIPSFPLDVLIAAHYIKETNISCKQYLQYSSSHHQNFRNAQLNILNDVGEYSKTRYDIITLPIQYMVEKSSDFRDLLIMISNISSLDIPKKLLASYKGDIIVDNFIYALKKFSLITKETHQKNGLGQVFSIHKSTQEVIFAYFVNSLQFAEHPNQLHTISVFLENYLSNILDEHDFLKIQSFVPHIEKFLTNSRLFNKQDIARLNKKLGISYFYLGKYEKAKIAFYNALEIYKQDKNNEIEKAKVLARLGAVYRNTADFQKAKECLEKALKSYERYYGSNHVETARISSTLGSVYRNIGDYPRAKNLLENGHTIFEKQYNKEHKNTIWSLSYLGQLYKNIGSYTEAREILEKTFSTYEKEFGKTHTKTAWSLVHLASVYRSIGYPEKAKEYLIRAIEIYKLRCGEESFEYAWSKVHLSAVYRDLGKLDEAINILKGSISFYDNNLPVGHITHGWIKFHLGNAYRDKGNKELAKECLNESLLINEKHYGKNHIKIAQILNSLAKLAIINQNFEQAKLYLEKALKIYSIHDHYDRYKTYEALGDLYSEMYKSKSDKALIDISSENFQRAISIIENAFPADSIHITRIKFKLASFEEN